MTGFSFPRIALQIHDRTYCLIWPQTLYDLLALFRIVGVDFVAQSRVPCFVQKFDYFDLVVIVAWVPAAFTAFIVLCCIGRRC